jgi:cyclic pyranopterin phosphate synthase
MKDKYNRTINYLRISVIDRCNLRCIYCMPENNLTWLNHEDILSFEEIVKTVKYAVQLGINKIRLTGGEPLVRRDIINLVKMIANIEGIKDFAMTTNGILLSQYAKALKGAGLHRVNISLDTLNAERFYKLTRGGNIQNVLDGIKAAQRAELLPIKLNCIVDESFDSRDRIEI